MKKRGLTTIELIIFLIVIILIVVVIIPSIFNIFSSSKNSKKENYVLEYIDSVEKQILKIYTYNSGTMISSGVYTIKQLEKLDIKAKQNFPDKKSVLKISNDGIVEEGWFIYKNGSKVYYDGKKATLSKDNNYIDSKGSTHNSVPNPKKNLEIIYSSYKIGDLVRIKNTEWFVLEDSDRDNSNVRLISKYNIFKDANRKTTNLEMFRKENSEYELEFDLFNEDSILRKKLVVNFVSALNNLDLEIENIQMMNYVDLENLGCSVSLEKGGTVRGIDCSNSKYLDKMLKGTNSWINAISFDNNAFYISESGEIKKADRNNGIRPIVDINKLKIG